jgi:hypothetical protein
MPAQRFLIAPYNENGGLTTDVKPWHIPDNAFSTLQNAYIFRGRVRKRFGSRWFGNDQLSSRLRVNIGNVPAMGAVNLPNVPIQLQIGQIFSVGNDIFTIYQLGVGVLTYSTNAAATATINSVAIPNTVTFTGEVAGTPIYWYPSLPVMGLLSIETSVLNNEPIIGFDTQFAYQYVNTGWERLNLFTNAGDSVWTGSTSQLFWGTTWTGASPSDIVFFTTNFNQNEPNFMRYMLASNFIWTTFKPQIDTTPNYVTSARIIVPFKNRLLLLNTWEGPNIGGAVNYPGRVRYSQIGSPLTANAFQIPPGGTGNGLDATTTEAIVGCEFIKDRLIVFFERSTWELVYTANQVNPFAWQKINTELGSESTFSTVSFDKVALAIGNTGVHACNGANVERIDQKIPQFIFSISDSLESPERVYGIRDFFLETAYWAFYSTNYDDTSTIQFNNQVLVYNYQNRTWSAFDDSITAFGYYQPSKGILWGSDEILWDSNTLWGNSPTQAFFRNVVAGNQEGYTFICDSQQDINARVLQITNIIVSATSVTLTIINHNLMAQNTPTQAYNATSYIYIKDCVFDDMSAGINDTVFQIIQVVDSNTIVIDSSALPLITGTYMGGGTVSRVSQLNIITKEYNFFAEQGRNAYISKVDFMVDATGGGQVQVNYFVSTNINSFLQEAQATGTLIGTGNLDTFPYTLANVPLGVVVPLEYEGNSTRLWHPVFFQADGEIVQFQITLNDTQMRSKSSWQADFQLHAMCIYAEPTSSRLQ